MTLASGNAAVHGATAIEQYADTAKRYLADLAEQTALVDTERLAAFTSLVTGTLDTGRTVFLAGNGGSASTAGHMACDWLNACARARMDRADVVSLADGVAVLTALANDLSFEDVFVSQLRRRGAPDDLLVLLSVSGSSGNLVEAARWARHNGLKVAGLLGDAGALAEHCDVSVVLGGGDYGLTEDLHLTVNHIVVRALGGGVPLRLPDRTSA
ncbi:D-sedoheptulose-7-phosphate isomerase [Streptomyces naphthomycinicus]|uniref:D-sedoheptulose-7-phosphate isomerase n=1 Tax=Streptomyces naphthomycinicus TaxID=2872625 RepID=UPI001CEDA4CC|nr:SIS domain-containing protein [Streptomyces sp. TML10]